MSISRQEELLAVLWAIAAILCFGFNFTTYGWAFAAKSVFDTGCSILYVIKEGK